MADVVFTYTSGGQSVPTTLLWSQRIASREGLGLWHVGNQAWKVFSTRAQYVALSADYRRAAVDAGLPMGNPSFQQGTVRRGTAPATQGFVLRTEWMVGSTFLHTAGQFQTALTRENFPRAITSVDYQRMRAGTVAANHVGLVDPQGFLRAGLFEPLRFIDVHTSWNQQTQQYRPSEVARQIMQIAINWGQ